MLFVELEPHLVFERHCVEFARSLEGGVDNRLRNAVAGHIRSRPSRRHAGHPPQRHRVPRAPRKRGPKSIMGIARVASSTLLTAIPEDIHRVLRIGNQSRLVPQCHRMLRKLGSERAGSSSRIVCSSMVRHRQAPRSDRGAESLGDCIARSRRAAPSSETRPFDATMTPGPDKE